MATVKICDWNKTPILGSDPVITLNLNNQSFEVCQKAYEEILNRLTNNDAVQVSKPPQRQNIVDMLNMPVADDALDTMDNAPGVDLVELHIPDNIKQRLPTPSKDTVDRVLKEAQIFPQGTLPSLGSGSARKEAMKKIEKIDKDQERFLQRKAGSDINFKFSDKKGVSDEE